MTPHGTLTWFLLTTTAANAQTYCDPVGYQGPDYGDFIAGVQLGTINNTSSFTPAAYYVDYTFANANCAARLAPGSTYTLDITGGTHVGARYAAWMDLDASGTFDPDELLGDHETTTVAEVISFPVNVPGSAVAGYTRLRVRCYWGVLPTADPCAQSTYGETEDYAVLVDDGSPCIPLITYGTRFLNQVQGVQLADLDNLSQTPQEQRAYSNYTDLTAHLTIGAPYELRIACGIDDQDRVKAWLDRNADGDWDDVGEVIGDAAVSMSFDTLVFPLTIAPGYTGDARLRVIEYRDANIVDGPCDDRSHGETEDYTVNIVLNTGAEELDAASPLMHPSTGGTGMILVTTGPWYGTTAMVLDSSGRLVTSARISGTRTELDLRDAPCGIYIVQLNAGGHTWTGRFPWITR